MKAELEVAGVKYGYSQLSVTEVVKGLGAWSASLEEVDNTIDGLSDILVYRGGTAYFKGRLLSPNKRVDVSGRRMPLGGLEYTHHLTRFLTPLETLTTVSPTSALTSILENAPFTVGTVDTFNPVGITTTYDTALEFLPWTYTDLCIIYGTTEEITDELTAGTFEVPTSNRRSEFYDHSTGYFFKIVYDNDNNLLKYDSTADFVTWKGWTSLGFNAGDNGTFGLCWDETNGRLFLVVDDGANLDYYRYSSAGGTLTQQDTDANVCAGDLVCGPIIDSEGDVWFICEDAGEADYELWQFDYSASTWTEETDWAIANNDDPKYLFMGDDAGDVIVVIFDDDANDIDEWLWDESGSTFAYVRKIDDLNNNDCGYICGFQDVNKNMFLIWEDEYAAGDADLYFSYRYIDDTSWEASEKVIDDDDYQSMNNFQLSGDDAGTLYLFYINDDGATRTLDIIRRFQDTWGTTTSLETTGIDATSYPRSPENGLALFLSWLDSGEDIHMSLMAPYSISVEKEFDTPPFYDDFEDATDFDGTDTSAGIGTVSTTNQDNPFSKQRNAKFTLPHGQVTKYACLYEEISGEGVGDTIYMAAKNVKLSAMPDDGEEVFMFVASDLPASTAIAYVGLTRNGDELYWCAWYRDDPGGGEVFQALHDSGVEAYVGINYDVEVSIKRDAAAGWVKLWVDGVSVINITALNNNDRNLDYGNFGMLYTNTGSTEINVYLDDCMISSKRIGPNVAGNVRTDTHNADGGMTEWGYLRSDNHPTAHTLWDVLKAADNSVLLDDQMVPVDMNAAGLSSAETAIKIQPYLTTHPLLYEYIFEIVISEVTEQISMDLDFDECYTKIQVVADVLGGEFRLRWDEDNEDEVDLLTALGEDKSDRIVLKTSRSLSVEPNIKPNIMMVWYEEEWRSFANHLKVIGQGTAGVDRVEVTVIDTDSSYVETWKTLRNYDLVNVVMAETYGGSQGSNYFEPQISIACRFIDEFDDIDVGDTVRVVDEVLNIDADYRIMELTRTWGGAGDETVHAVLNEQGKGVAMVRRLKVIHDATRWIVG